jgi:hypothetical protein
MAGTELPSIGRDGHGTPRSLPAFDWFSSGRAISRLREVSRRRSEERTEAPFADDREAAVMAHIPRSYGSAVNGQWELYPNPHLSEGTLEGAVWLVGTDDE